MGESLQQGLFEGVFRRGWPGGSADLAPVYRDAAPFLWEGLTGHLIGKSFVRRGQRLNMGIHFPKPPRRVHLQPEVSDVGLMGPLADEGWLIHFDGMTTLHWRLKLLRYALSRQRALKESGMAFRWLAWMRKRLKGTNGPGFREQSPGRERQLRAVLDGRKDTAALAQLTRALALDAMAHNRLANLTDGFLALHCRPDEAALKRFDLTSEDFTAARFNGELRLRYPALTAEVSLPGDA